jgi:hypothetical protein
LLSIKYFFAASLPCWIILDMIDIIFHSIVYDY